MKPIIKYELKPCPFCGERAYLYLNCERTAVFIECDVCCTRTREFVSIPDAVKRWNTRGEILDE